MAPYIPGALRSPGELGSADALTYFGDLAGPRLTLRGLTLHAAAASVWEMRGAIRPPGLFASSPPTCMFAILAAIMARWLSFRCRRWRFDQKNGSRRVRDSSIAMCRWIGPGRFGISSIHVPVRRSSVFSSGDGGRPTASWIAWTSSALVRSIGGLATSMLGSGSTTTVRIRVLPLSTMASSGRT